MQPCLQTLSPQNKQYGYLDGSYELTTLQTCSTSWSFCFAYKCLATNRVNSFAKLILYNLYFCPLWVTSHSAVLVRWVSCWSCATISNKSTVGPLFRMCLGKREKHPEKPNLHSTSFKSHSDTDCAKVGMKGSFCFFLYTAKYPETPSRSRLNPCTLFYEKAIFFECRLDLFGLGGNAFII